MGSAITGSPPKPDQFQSWQDWAAQLADFLELQGNLLAELSLTGLPATPIVMGSQRIAPGGLAAATGLTVPAGTVVAYIQVEGQQVRWYDDGTIPTATTGYIIDVGETLAYSGDFTKLKLTETSPSSVLNILYRR